MNCPVREKWCCTAGGILLLVSGVQYLEDNGLIFVFAEC